MKDITGREDIEKLVHTFYSKAMNDVIIQHFFNEVTTLNLETHLPKICDFWESVLFKHRTYQGNPMIKHIELSRKSKMTSEHFERWLKLWEATVRELFQGELANEAIYRANQIAILMQHKIRMNP